MSDLRPSGPERNGRRTASNVLLAVGYPVAGWVAARLIPMYRDEDRTRFLALEAGTACVTAGHLLARRRLAATLNAGALVAFAGVWLTYRRPPG
jgi:hypothetical protein